jgi:hypothetical protein
MSPARRRLAPSSTAVVVSQPMSSLVKGCAGESCCNTPITVLLVPSSPMIEDRRDQVTPR